MLAINLEWRIQNLTSPAQSSLLLVLNLYLRSKLNHVTLFPPKLMTFERSRTIAMKCSAGKTGPRAALDGQRRSLLFTGHFAARH